MHHRHADEPDANELFYHLQAAKTQLANFTYKLTSELAAEDYYLELMTLRERIAGLELELSRSSSDYGEIPTLPKLIDIQNNLSDDSALVEFVRYQHYEPAISPNWGTDHYAAYILLSDGTIKGMDLGPADIIDGAVRTLASSLASSSTPISQVKEESQALYAMVMAPVQEALDNKTTVFISPDSALNLIPFEALVDENNSYLVERYQFRYLISGRDLMQVENITITARNNPAVLMGAPSFGRADNTISEPIEIDQRQRAINFENNIFPTLSNTEAEIHGIAVRFPNAQTYLTNAATEAQIKDIKSPRILHVATHGFFTDTSDSRNPFLHASNYGFLTRGISGINPLLRSGLVLAGVKERQSGPDQDGILTALEMSALDLRGTQLVVLSACETGIGELSAGEGIYGLRRALALAGSQSQVVSLWKVDDLATQELMLIYYDKLLAGTSRDAAIRETQLAFLQAPEYGHPYYWAAFIGSGDWRPLDME